MAAKKDMKKLSWVLTRERFQLPPDAPRNEDCSVPISDVLRGIFKKIDSEKRPWLDELRSEWNHLMGDLVAGHAYPAGVRGSVLIVFVDSSVWLSEIQRFKRAEMLCRLQRRYGKAISEIVLRIGQPKREAES